MPTTAESSVGNIKQQIGEIQGIVKAMSDQFREQREAAIRQEDRITNEIREIKHEQRQENQTNKARLELLTIQVGQLDDKAKSIASDVASLSQDVSQLTTRVEPVIELRKTLVAYGLVGVSAVTVLWYVVGPFIESYLRHVAGISH